LFKSRRRGDILGFKNGVIVVWGFDFKLSRLLLFNNGLVNGTVGIGVEFSLLVLLFVIIALTFVLLEEKYLLVTIIFTLSLILLSTAWVVLLVSCSVISFIGESGIISSNSIFDFFGEAGDAGIKISSSVWEFSLFKLSSYDLFLLLDTSGNSSRSIGEFSVNSSLFSGFNKVPNFTRGGTNCFFYFSGKGSKVISNFVFLYR